MSVIIIIEHRCCILGNRHTQLISKYSGSHETGLVHLICEIPEEEIRKDKADPQAFMNIRFLIRRHYKSEQFSVQNCQVVENFNIYINLQSSIL